MRTEFYNNSKPGATGRFPASMKAEVYPFDTNRDVVIRVFYIDASSWISWQANWYPANYVDMYIEALQRAVEISRNLEANNGSFVDGEA